MDMKKFMDAVKEPSQIEKTDAKDMHQFLSIVTEGKNTTTNRLSMAEQMAVQQYTPETKKNITNPVLNVSKDAKPSMIGKYFKAVEEEIAEAQERTKDRAKLIAERVISKMHSASKQRIEEYYNVPATDSKSPIPGHVSGCQCKEVEEGLKDPKDNPCWKGYKPVGTKKKGGRTVPNCVPKEAVTEGTDPNKLAASVTLDGEFKEFDLTPLIAKNNWVGAPKQVINQADKYLGDFFRKRGSAYSNLEITYKGTTLKANQVGDVDAPDLEFESMQDVMEGSEQKISDYDAWRDQVDAQGGEIHPQKDRVRLVAQSWDGDTIGEFNLKTNQGYINGQQGMAKGGPKGYDSDGNPLGGGYDEYENNWVVTIDGKTWKTFDDERQAYKAAAAIERKYGKKTRVYKN